MKPYQLTPEQIKQALRNARGGYDRSERLMMARHVFRLWQEKARETNRAQS